MMKIRPLNTTDRSLIRQICCDVADRGEAVEQIFPDREVAADLLTNYYIDYEPESSFVAELDGKIIAYVNGCLDNRRYGLALLFLILPKVFLKGLIRGVFFRSEFWQFAKGMGRNWKMIFSWRKQSFHSHQGHLHIGVAKEYRRQQAGKLLVEALLAHARGKDVAEIAASVHEENSAACDFFERLGFVAKDRYVMVTALGNSLKEYRSVLYVKTMH